jgi:hypothetical protein
MKEKNNKTKLQQSGQIIHSRGTSETHLIKTLSRCEHKANNGSSKCQTSEQLQEILNQIINAYVEETIN